MINEMINEQEYQFFKKEDSKRIARTQYINNLLAEPVNMEDQTAFCPKCKQYTLRFTARQARSIDEAETFILKCTNIECQA